MKTDNPVFGQLHGHPSVTIKLRVGYFLT